MTIKIGINGFGRIGRCILRAGINRSDVEFVGINDLTNAEELAFLFKYDSVHRKFDGEVSTEDGFLIVNGKRIPITAERDPAKLPWAERGADIVHECTGRFVKDEDAAKHLEAGAKWVLISAPGKGDGVKTVAYGVNHETLNVAEDRIISNASCTTNCLAPMAKTLNDAFGIEKGLMTTIHAYTSTQSILDTPGQKDWRRGRAAALSMIPTTTGAAKAVGLRSCPSSTGLPRWDGGPRPHAQRVPDRPHRDPVSREVSADEIQQPPCARRRRRALSRASWSTPTDPLVSIDINGNPASSRLYRRPHPRARVDLVKVMGPGMTTSGASPCRMLDLSTYIDANR